MPADHDWTDVTHGMADIEPGLRLHFTTAGRGLRTIVLLHGFPQTWWEWRRVGPALVLTASAWWLPTIGVPTFVASARRLRQADDGQRHPSAAAPAVADQGSGRSRRARHRADGRLRLRQGPPGRGVPPGGGGRAAARHDGVRSPAQRPPGLAFRLHGARDVAEMLVAGRERQYLQAFFNARCFDPSAIGQEDLEIYTSAYAAAGAMRAGFEGCIAPSTRTRRTTVRRWGAMESCPCRSWRWVVPAVRRARWSRA